MLIRISRLHYPVTVLGPGRRLGIWFQGCAIGCNGCVSKDTWNIDAGNLIEIQSLVENCRTWIGDELDGITISGGEPFDQPEELKALLNELNPWRVSAGFDILCYSGRSLKYLENHHSDILSNLDFLIPEPFVEKLPTEAVWRGSANQPLLALSELGRNKLKLPINYTSGLQVQVDNNVVWFIGIPRRGDMGLLQSRLQKKGVLMGDVSWS
jgi:anaerobic ribonucleoside-triphosphate reductase activating protein